MTSNPGQDHVPSWSGDASEFEAYATACKWYQKATKESERKLIVARLWGRLHGAAKSVVKHLDPDRFEDEGGLQRFLEVLRASPLQHLPIPDSFARLEKWNYLKNPYPLNPQNQGGTSENVSYIFGRAPGTPKNVSWNPPRCPEWSVFEGGGGAPKNVSWNLEGHNLHFCPPPPPFQKFVHQDSKLPEGGGGETIQNGLTPQENALRRCLRD